MHSHRIILLVAITVSVGYAWLNGAFVGLVPAHDDGGVAAQGRHLQKATFAAGCFWCVEADFDKVKGVVETVSGYTGGQVAHPTHDQVAFGGTGHAEAVEVTFDPAIVTYEQLLDHYWRNVDPFVDGRQFCDRGTQYRPGIIVHDEQQRAAAEASKQRMQQLFSQPIVVSIGDAGPFYRAEASHQNYHAEHRVQYSYYRWRCGRDERLAEIWAGRE